MLLFLLLFLHFLRARSTQERAGKGSVQVSGTYLLWNMMECLLSIFHENQSVPALISCFHSSGLLKNVASVTVGQTAWVAPFGSNGLKLWPAMLTLLDKNTGRYTSFLSLWGLSSISFQYLLAKCLMGWEEYFLLAGLTCVTVLDSRP